MQISCHFGYCKALLFLSLTRVSSTTASVQSFNVKTDKKSQYFVSAAYYIHVTQVSLHETSHFADMKLFIFSGQWTQKLHFLADDRHYSTHQLTYLHHHRSISND